jgi:hypothetical protein
VSEWRIHWLEAEGDLQPWRARIASEIEAAREVILRLVSPPPPPLDILVQRLSGAAVIPEIGMAGQAFRKGLFALTVDPDNPRFLDSLADGALQRQVAHEAHHCMRMAKLGYGRTLGEALVSEGLAGRFVTHLFESPPEPWERAVDKSTLLAHRPDDQMLASTDYNHDSWFFGVGGQRPRWLGYTLGYEMVGKWLETAGELEYSAWIEVSTESILAARWL